LDKAPEGPWRKIRVIAKWLNLQGCEIRTHEGLATLPVFKTGAFNRSANLPILQWLQ